MTINQLGMKIRKLCKKFVQRKLEFFLLRDSNICIYLSSGYRAMT